MEKSSEFKNGSMEVSIDGETVAVSYRWCLHDYSYTVNYGGFVLEDGAHVPYPNPNKLNEERVRDRVDTRTRDIVYLIRKFSLCQEDLTAELGVMLESFSEMAEQEQLFVRKMDKVRKVLLEGGLISQKEFETRARDIREGLEVLNAKCGDAVKDCIKKYMGPQDPMEYRRTMDLLCSLKGTTFPSQQVNFFSVKL